MANLRISELVDGGIVQDADEFVVARGGDNFSILGTLFRNIEFDTLADASAVGTTGSGSIPLGSGSSATSEKGLAFGTDAVASGGPDNVAIGFSASSTGNFNGFLGSSTAIGRFSVASGFASVCVGAGVASGLGSLSLIQGIASGDASVAIGTGAEASGGSSQALTPGALTSGDRSICYSLSGLSTTAIVSGEQSFGIFLSRSNGYDITSDNTFTMVGGKVLFDHYEAKSGLDPIASLQSVGSFATKTTTIDADVTLDTTHHIVLVNDTAARVVTLPAAAGNDGLQYIIKKVGTGGNVTVSGTIDGAASYVLSSQYDSVSVVCDGTAWFIIG